MQNPQVAVTRLQGERFPAALVRQSHDPAMHFLGRDRTGEPSRKGQGKAAPAFHDLVQRALPGPAATECPAFLDDPLAQFLQCHRASPLGQVLQVQRDGVRQAGVRHPRQPSKCLLGRDLLRIRQSPGFVGVVAQVAFQPGAVPLRNRLRLEDLPARLGVLLLA